MLTMDGAFLKKLLNALKAHQLVGVSKGRWVNGFDPCGGEHGEKAVSIDNGVDDMLSAEKLWQSYYCWHRGW